MLELKEKKTTTTTTTSSVDDEGNNVDRFASASEQTLCFFIDVQDEKRKKTIPIEKRAQRPEAMKPEEIDVSIGKIYFQEKSEFESSSRIRSVFRRISFFS